MGGGWGTMKGHGNQVLYLPLENNPNVFTVLRFTSNSTNTSAVVPKTHSHCKEPCLQMSS